MRDILVGAQQRASEERFAHLEQALANQGTQLAELRARLEQFEAQTHQGLADERQERRKAIEDLAARLERLSQANERSLAEVLEQGRQQRQAQEEAASEREAALRRDYEEQNARLREHFDTVVDELDQRSVDRSLLAEWFATLADRLRSGDASPPDSGGKRGG